ncbi:hypothetical protein IF2G_02651 [Cordyceps javanica]|nr:hypothetical protein IF2G_02651 [Cordyceps javanica]
MGQRRRGIPSISSDKMTARAAFFHRGSRAVAVYITGESLLVSGAVHCWTQATWQIRRPRPTVRQRRVPGQAGLSIPASPRQREATVG